MKVNKPYIRDTRLLMPNRQRSEGRVGEVKAEPLIGLPNIISKVKEMIRSAKKEVVLGIYLWGKPDILEELKRAAQRGVKVKVVVDPYGYEDKGPGDEVIKDLRKAGVEIYKYPTSKLPSSVTERVRGELSKLPLDIVSSYSHSRAKYHVKAMVVDSERMYLGSGNLEEDGWEQCYDTGVYLEDKRVTKAVRDILLKDFSLASKKGDKGRMVKPYQTFSGLRGEMIRLAVSPEEKALKEMIVDEIDSAKKSIDLEMFVLADPDVVKALMRAAKRKVKVRIIANVFADNPLFNLINTSVAKKLSENGAEIKLFSPDKRTKWFHSKLAIIDSKKVVVTTGNWSLPGFKHNRELGIAIENDTELARKFEANFNELFNRKDYKLLNKKVFKTVTGRVAGTLGWLALELTDKAELL